MFNDLSYKTLLPSIKPKSISNVEVKDENGLHNGEWRKETGTEIKIMLRANHTRDAMKYFTRQVLQKLPPIKVQTQVCSNKSQYDLENSNTFIFSRWLRAVKINSYMGWSASLRVITDIFFWWLVIIGSHWLPKYISTYVLHMYLVLFHHCTTLSLSFRTLHCCYK